MSDDAPNRQRLAALLRWATADGCTDADQLALRLAEHGVTFASGAALAGAAPTEPHGKW